MIELRKKSSVVHVANVPVGGGKPWVLIAGPCAIESESMALQTAERLAEIAAILNIPYIFKGSYDKANRLSIESERGIGFKAGMDILSKIREEIGVPVLTDVHDPISAKKASRHVDCLQIPAFLCRQTDLVVAAAATEKPINIKKGQFLAPDDMIHIANKATESGASGIMLTERGTSFGYNNLVVDFRSIPIMAKSGWSVVMDISHSQQRPGSQGGSSGGSREFIPHFALAALSLGVDAIYMEVHPDPENAISDRMTQWPLKKTPDLLKFLKDKYSD